jgi:hypothetical protein
MKINGFKKFNHNNLPKVIERFAIYDGHGWILLTIKNT